MHAKYLEEVKTHNTHHFAEFTQDIHLFCVRPEYCVHQNKSKNHPFRQLSLLSRSLQICMAFR